MKKLEVSDIKKPSNWQLALHEFATAARRELGDNIIRIILYGSRARGDYTEDSDIDVLVVVNADKLDPDETLVNLGRFTYDILIDYNELIALNVVSDDRYKSNQGYSYYQFIAEEGVSI